MYLINVKTFQLEFFQDDRNHEYAILSHRWQEEEVLFRDMQTGGASRKKGFAKLKRFCEEAAAAQYTYAWCDTCCIDKDSSAELSESINSMFRWYKNAGVCYAFLYDVTARMVQSAADLKSEWFARGWCLQELVAPRDMVFFNAGWDRLGSRDNLSIFVSDITGIHTVALGGDLDRFSVAQRMSWAAGRQTTRSEDIAYSLLGVFGVNMPLLYGEGGERAFARLQDEIMKESADHSIFAHASQGDKQRLLAESPADFRDSAHVVRDGPPLLGEPYTLTNVGLSVSLILYTWSLEVYVALLDCSDSQANDRLGIFIQLQPQLPQREQIFATEHAVRIKYKGKAWTTASGIEALPSVQKRLYLERGLGQHTQRRHGFFVRRFHGENDWAKDQLVWAVSHNKWDNNRRIVEIEEGTQSTVAVMVCEVPEGRNQFQCFVRLAFDADSVPMVELGGDEFSPPEEFRDSDKIYILSADEFARGHNKPADPSFTKSTVLADRRWTDVSKVSYRSSRTVLQPVGRDERFRHHHSIGIGGYSLDVFCRKMVVDGILTWTLDIVWRIGRDGIRKVDKKTYRDAICDCCEEVRMQWRNSAAHL